MLKKILNNKIFKIIYGIIKYTFIAMMVLYVVFILLQKVTNNSSVLGLRFFTIASNSMYPVYEINDVIIVKDVDVNTLNVGDDITYYGELNDFKDKIVTHRIISKDSNTFTTKGVNNTIEDPSIEYNQVLGKVVYKPVIISFISTVIKNQYGFYFLVFTPLVLVMFLEIADTVIELKDKKND